MTWSLLFPLHIIPTNLPINKTIKEQNSTHVWLLNSFMISKKSLYTWGCVLNLYFTWSRYDSASSTFSRWNWAPAGGWAPWGPTPGAPTPGGPTPTAGAGSGAGAGDWRPNAAGMDARFGCWGGKVCCWQRYSFSGLFKGCFWLGVVGIVSYNKIAAVNLFMDVKR